MRTTSILLGLLLTACGGGGGGGGNDSGPPVSGTPTPVTSPTPGTTPAPTSPFALDMLDQHNRVRRAENAGLADLSWSADLAAFAQDWANRSASNGQCLNLTHRSGSERNLNGQVTGENLSAFGSSSPYSGYQDTPAGVVGRWAAERADWNFSSMQCRAGAVCGHYTQIVWRDTTAVGCGQARCAQSEVWVCNYLPAGNVAGRNPF
ncbi:CAP domain-containing protein [Jeongeupia naejangsanensis]|uniref:SCP-like extracellular n=1 Tax=Jeongeupia naejangsanensis TaxID=613195 RepID=A0ABS2BHZ8_9NEIS|nr:CAP domain-containing protein [Jeongeupia naejangsanensis]MBM3115060.1 SCP-like extracellular [Jeongeupia naejangsanensis]